MKRLCVFVIALFCTLTASAAGSAINRVTLNGAAVTVNVTAETDCALTVALYDADGRLLDVQTRDVGATAGRDVSVTMAGGIPSGSVAKAFLTGADNKPVCKAASSSDSGGNGGGDTPTPAPATDDVYAILYADGTLVFQHGNTPQAERQVRETYAVDVTEHYRYDEIPWRSARAFIYQVDFADKIQPTSTARWFEECTKLREIKNIKNLDTANVISMKRMFDSCGRLTTLDVSGFNTANVTDMNDMFFGCGALTTLDVSGFNTANVTDMNEMFRLCGALTALDVSKFDTANVTDMSGMFDSCGALTTLDVSGFDTANVTDMSEMFSGCRALTTLDVSGFNTANVTDMSFMFADLFSGCAALTELDVSGFDTANVTRMRSMFCGCGALTTLDVSGFDTTNVTNMSDMFGQCLGLIAIYASPKFLTSQVTDSDRMFSGCEFLVGGNGTTYDNKHVDMEYARIDGGASAPGYFTAK